MTYQPKCRDILVCAGVLSVSSALLSFLGASSASAQTATATRRFRGSLLVGDATEMVVLGHNGNIYAKGENTRNVAFRAMLKTNSVSEAAHDAIRLFKRGRTIYLEDACSSRSVLFWRVSDCDVSYTILYPRSLSVRLVLENGNINEEAGSGRIQAKTGNGNVTVNEAGSDVVASATNGRVAIALSPRWSGSRISAQTHAGNINIRVPSWLDASVHVSDPWGSHPSGNADLRPGRVEIDASTVFGSVRIDRLNS